MRKRYFYLTLLLLFITGCSCEYNLNIEDNIYEEKIIIKSTTNYEKNNMNMKFQIPVDIDEYDLGIDDDNYIVDGDVYNYNFDGNNLNLKYTFTNNSFSNSSAINECYSKVTVTTLEGKLIISTSDNFLCFDEYSGLTSLKINITTNKKVISNNADSFNNNTYTWNLTKNSIKAINMVMENNNNNNSNSSSKPIDNSNNVNNEKNKVLNIVKNNNSNMLLIFILIILIVIFICFLMFSNLKDNNSKLDD